MPKEGITVDLRDSRDIFMANQHMDDYAAKSFKVRTDYLPLVKEIMIPQYEIIGKEREILAEIEMDYKGEDPLFIPILKGAVRFAVDMFRFAERIDPEFEFMSASSYGRKLESTGKVDIDLKGISRLLEKLKDRNRPVILVEDIVDTGDTLSHIVNVLENIDDILDSMEDFSAFERVGSYKPSSVNICSLINKPCRRKEENQSLPIKYLGFTIPNKWIFGYGLDVWGDRGRTLDHICVLSDEYKQDGKLEEFFTKLDNCNGRDGHQV
jgi:hypoxanthine phosphoribosyltransferase